MTIISIYADQRKLLGLILAFFICFCSAYFVFAVKSASETAIFQLNEIKYQISQEQNNIHILKTELALLTNANNIKSLASKYLVLEPIKPNHIVNSINAELNNKVNDISKVNISAQQRAMLLEENTEWRYKKPIYKNVKHSFVVAKKNSNQSKKLLSANN